MTQVEPMASGLEGDLVGRRARDQADPWTYGDL